MAQALCFLNVWFFASLRCAQPVSCTINKICQATTASPPWSPRLWNKISSYSLKKTKHSFHTTYEHPHILPYAWNHVLITYIIHFSAFLNYNKILEAGFITKKRGSRMQNQKPTFGDRLLAGRTLKQHRASQGKRQEMCLVFSSCFEVSRIPSCGRNAIDLT